MCRWRSSDGTRRWSRPNHDVHLVGMEDGMLPHHRTLDSPEEIEEERRLAYVGITRAQRHLSISHTRTRRLFGTARHGTTDTDRMRGPNHQGDSTDERLLGCCQATLERRTRGQFLRRRKCRQ
ncbi:MAG: hypothetical protein OXN44_08300 [Acidimicrobiaceae bacterium]|nr:hypothetical protein [Acidimicrobiaceae bacterium]